MINLALLGATGRMGTRVLSMLEGDSRFQLVAALVSSDDPRKGQATAAAGRSVTFSTDIDAAFDVLLDFSVPDGTMQWLNRCVERKSAMVIGATGYSAEQQARIEAAAKKTAILQASNFSIGIALLRLLIKQAARTIGHQADIEVIEHHHNQKIDAPSGTARTIVNDLCESLSRDPTKDVVYGRQGEVGIRPAGQIGVHSVRMGALTGHHEVHFSQAEESIHLAHTAHSRDVFARGALDAAAWLARKPAGRYSIENLLPMTP